MYEEIKAKCESMEKELRVLSEEIDTEDNTFAIDLCHAINRAKRELNRAANCIKNYFEGK